MLAGERRGIERKRQREKERERKRQGAEEIGRSGVCVGVREQERERERERACKPATRLSVSAAMCKGVLPCEFCASISSLCGSNRSSTRGFVFAELAAWCIA